MAKRLRDEESSQVLTTEERGAKRHATSGGGGGLAAENYALLPGWDALAAAKQLGTSSAVGQQPLAVPAAHQLGKPLRPANQQLGTTTAPYPQQQQQQVQQPVQPAEQHPAGGAAADVAEAQAAAAAAAIDIDWQCPQQVAQLLRMLHVERLRRLGQELPAEYQQP